MDHIEPFYKNDNYSSFDDRENEYSKLFDKMIRETNTEILDSDVLDNAVKDFCLELIKGYKDDNSDWKNIFAEKEIDCSPKYRIFSNNKQHFFREFIRAEVYPDRNEAANYSNRSSDEYEDDLDFNDIDTAGLLNTLIYRFFDNIVPVKNAAYKMRNLRNIIEGHRSRNDFTEINRCPKFYDYTPNESDNQNSWSYQDMVDKIKNVVTSRCAQYIKKAAEKLYDRLILLKAMEDFIKNNSTNNEVIIDPDSEERIPKQYLASYNIFFTPSALVSDEALNNAKDCFRTLCEMTRYKNVKFKKKYGINLFSEDIRIIERYKEKGLRRGEEFSDAFNDFYDVIREIDDPSNYEDFFRDKKEKYIIFTGSSDTAEKILSLNKKNVIPGQIVSGSGKFFKVFHPDKTRETQPSKPERADITEQLDSYSTRTNDDQNEFIMPDKNDMPASGGAIEIKYKRDWASRQLGNEYDKGGEGTVFGIKGHDTDCIKIYNFESWKYSTFEKLREMINEKDLREAKNICWPKEFVRYKQCDVGFTMMKIGKGAKTLSKLLEDINGENPWRWERQQLAILCRNIAEAFKKLHSRGVLMGDINLKNIMVDENQKVYFIDTDSYQFKNYYCKVSTPEFNSPRIIELQRSASVGYGGIKRTLEDEYFAEAILFFKILTIDDYPFVNTVDPEEAILRGKYRFAKETTRKDRLPKDMYNQIIGNLTNDINIMFTEIFTNKAPKGKYNDDEFIHLFTALLSAINPNISDLRMSEFDPENPDKRLLSNQLRPTAKCSGKFSWIISVCSRCNQKYWSVTENTGKLCKTCLTKRDTKRANVRFKVCTKCRRSFCINEYDIEMARPFQGYCYDCDSTLKLNEINEDTLSYALEKFDERSFETGIRYDKEVTDQ